MPAPRSALRWCADRSVPAAVAASALAVLVLIAGPVVLGQRPTHRFLLWNLFLAWIPLAMALAAEAFEERRRWMAAVVAGGLWLLFLPNAPYLITDFVHLKPRPSIPLWYDMLMLLSFSGAGLLLGYASVMIVHRIVARHYGVVAGWATALTAMFLSAFGIYLGRFLRWNSWEAITEPMPLFRDIAVRLMNPLQHPKTFVVTGLFGIALCVGYVALDVMAESES